MAGYWRRHRLLWSFVFGVGIAAISVFLFVVPYVEKLSNDYNLRSVYKNSAVDFIVPEPSFEQVDSLPRTNGIDKVFPYFLTKTTVEYSGKTRTTTVLLSDQMDNVDFTMYSEKRLIEKSEKNVTNPIYVDWQFCKDTSAKVGDNVFITINGEKVEYQIVAIYETNSIYDGGAVLVELTDNQKASIMNTSKNSGYSGMYISSSDYGKSQTYLMNEYRPLGRLKSRELFDSDEQYQVHYDAIVSGNYANEITDFNVKKKEASSDNGFITVIVGAALVFVLNIAFSAFMRSRGTEKNYFRKQCIPRGQRVTGYYGRTIVWENILFAIAFIVFLYMAITQFSFYVPKSVLGFELLVIPAAYIIAEIVGYLSNLLMISALERESKEIHKEKSENIE